MDAPGAKGLYTGHGSRACPWWVGRSRVVQFLGSALQVTPHLHSLMPGSVFVPRKDGIRFEALPPSTQGEVELLRKVVRLLEKKGAPTQGPEDALQAY